MMAYCCCSYQDLKLLFFLATIAIYSQVESSPTRSGITSSTPMRCMPRYNVQPQLRAISLLSLSSCLLLQPKKALAQLPSSTSMLTAGSSMIPIIEKTVVANDEESILSSLISGAATRVSKELVLHPIDTVRARQQKAPNSANDSTSGIGINQEGLFDNLYDGLLPALVGGVPAGALFFGVKDYSKKKLRKLGLGKQESTILSVMLTNVPYWIVRTPSEVLKTRRQIGYDDDSSVSEMMTKMVQQESGVLPAIRSTYKSYASNFVYALPADIVKFVACKIELEAETLFLPAGMMYYIMLVTLKPIQALIHTRSCERCLNLLILFSICPTLLHVPVSIDEALTSSVLGINEGAKIQGLQAAVTGAAASLIAQAVTTPLDVTRTRIMSRMERKSSETIINQGGQEGEGRNNETNNPITELRNIVESEGASSLFSGLLPRAVRALASGGIQFASYELTQNALLRK